MKILFLHGLESSPNSRKVTFLRDMGHDVIAPLLDKNDWEQSVLAARNAIHVHDPDVVVGSSRGGAVAMAAHPRVPTVLVAPAWVKYAPWETVSGRTVIIHSIEDEVIPYEDSEKLRKMFGAKLIAAGASHRMSDTEALEAILSTCEAMA
tara:strand:- start:331 stop:780 length:450 start_codon:yes stop_codon:yes gene_type:complete